MSTPFSMPQNNDKPKIHLPVSRQSANLCKLCKSDYRINMCSTHYAFYMGRR
jgi:uncharacterized Zn-finger protein